MCFSATASFVAAGGLGAAGAITLREVKKRPQLPLAALPLMFGLQQAVEGVVWVARDIPWLQSSAAFLYVMFSHVLWPTYVPLAVMLVETGARRRSILKGFLVFGIALSAWLYSHIVAGPITTTYTAGGIVYGMLLPEIPYGLAAYVLVTCVACFISSHKFIRVFGLALTGALAIALWAYHEAFYSVWCFFAAILSFIVYAHFRQGMRLWPLPTSKLPNTALASKKK